MNNKNRIYFIDNSTINLKDFVENIKKIKNNKSIYFVTKTNYEKVKNVYIDLLIKTEVDVDFIYLNDNSFEKRTDITQFILSTKLNSLIKRKLNYQYVIVSKNEEFKALKEYYTMFYPETNIELKLSL